MILLDHSKKELELLGMLNPEEPMNNAISHHILHMINEFSKEEYSGFSAKYAIAILTKLLNYEPLTPLTGEDSEWKEIFPPSLDVRWQNKRCSRILKRPDGTCFDVEGKIFNEHYLDENGKEQIYSYIGKDSGVDVTFPYIPYTEYVDVGFRENT